MKKNNGISLMTLVVTIVVMLILAGATIYYGTRQNIDTAYTADMYTEVLNVSDAVKQRFLTNRIDSNRYPYVGTALTDDNPRVINNISYGDGWHFITAEQTLELNLENVTNEYIVNYLTGEVVSIKPIIHNNNEYYTLDDLKEQIGEDTTHVSETLYDAKEGINKPILVTGMVPVRNINGQWFVTNESDDRWYDYSATNKIWANVMLLDEITVSGYSNEAIRNTPISELDGRKVETSGSMFVWLPRHTSKDLSVVYSKLLEDYTKDGYSLPTSFTKDSHEVTGIWISKFDSDYSE